MTIDGYCECCMCVPASFNDGYCTNCGEYDSEADE